MQICNGQSSKTLRTNELFDVRVQNLSNTVMSRTIKLTNYRNEKKIYIYIYIEYKTWLSYTVISLRIFIDKLRPLFRDNNMQIILKQMIDIVK